MCEIIILLLLLFVKYFKATTLIKKIKNISNYFIQQFYFGKPKHFFVMTRQLKRVEMLHNIFFSNYIFVLVDNIL